MAAKVTIAEKVSYLAQAAAQGRWSPTMPVGDYKASQINRKYGALRKAETSGRRLTAQEFNRYSRGHDTTPEHPGRKRYESTGLSGGRPRAARRSSTTLTGHKIKRPLVHRRPGIPRKVELPGNAVVTTVPTAREALVEIRRAAKEGSRVALEVYDCEKNQWGRVFQNTRTNWGTPWIGMNASEMLRQWKASGMTFEAFLLSQIEVSESEKGPAEGPGGGYSNIGLGHICLYQVNVYPDPTPNPVHVRTA